MKHLITAIALIFILASCTSTDRSSSLYAGGSGGIVFSFEDGAPPSIVQDAGQTPMAMILRVRNTGEFDTRNVRFTLSGINANDFEGFSTGPFVVDSSRGKAMVQNQIVDGEEDFLDLGEAFYTRELRGSSLDFTLNAKACYPYATSATISVCLSSDYYNPSRSCDPGRSSVSSSAAPVTITNLETSAAGTNRLRVSFDVVKTGSGTVWAPYDGQICPSDQSTRIRESDRIYVRVDAAGNDISCSGLLQGDWDASSILETPQQYRNPLSNLESNADGFVRLSGNSARVQCTLTASSDVDAMSTIDVALAYYVEDSISKRFTVERSGMTGRDPNPTGSTPPTTPLDVTDGSEHT